MAEQLEEALGREAERLREEVGVDVEVRTGGAVEPRDPVTFLLAATDVLGVLAAVCERVTIELDGGVMLTGGGLVGPDRRAGPGPQAGGVGVAADDLAVDDEDESVTVTLRPRATATT